VKAAATGSAVRPPRTKALVRVTPVGWVAAFLLAPALTLDLPGVVLWPILAGLVAVHEGGHVVAARRFRYPIEEVVVGIGPKLVDLTISGMTMTLRAIPIVGWVAAEVDLSPRRYVHRRYMWFAAAGPIFSLGAALVLNLATAVAVDGVEGLTPSSVRQNVERTAEQAAAVPAMLMQAVGDAVEVVGDLFVPDGPADHAGSVHGPDRVGGNTGDGDASLVSVVGMAAVASSNVDRHGYVYALALAAALSASLAGVNLIPALGLDGSQIVMASLRGLRLRYPRVGRGLSVIFTSIGCVLLVVLGLMVLRAFVVDIANLV